MHYRWKLISALIVLSAIYALPARAQNWGLVIQDLAAGTPPNEVNGTNGGTATLYGIVYNYTGTDISDDGTGSNTPAPATLLDFAGFGWTLLPGQVDLGSRFTGIEFGAVQVAGSLDGVAPGNSGYVSFGTFDLTGLAPGFYEQDFSAAAFPSDFDSPVPFDQLTGTIRVNVLPATVPETSTLFLLGTVGAACCAVTIRRARVRGRP